MAVNSKKKNNGKIVKFRPRSDGTGRLPRFLILISVAFAALLARIFYIQFIKGDYYRARGESQWTWDLPVTALRGAILDRNGYTLAQSATTMTVLLRPPDILQSDDPEATADRVASALSEILGMEYDYIYAQCMRTDAQELWLKRQITVDQEKAILEANLVGVDFTSDSKRYYTQSYFLSQVLGYTTIDGVGQEGLEASYNAYLAGENGEIVSEKAASGEDIAYGVSYYREATDGYNVVTTIDYVIQSFVEQAIEDAQAELNADKIEAIVMDPDTGEILAMSMVPDMDNNNVPRDSAETLAELSRNAMIADAYEPGSVFKIITTSAALEEGLTNPDEMFCCTGSITVDGDTIKCWRSYNPHGSENLTMALRNSCNPVFVALALRLGTETFYDYIYNFGFGQRTGIDLYGEAIGIVTNEKYIRTADLARIGFGQSIAVTPIQMITAAAAVINGGELMQPYLVSAIEDSDGNVVESFEPTIVRRVISEETSATMRQMMQFVVDDGVVNARIEGVAVGGKTGTAQKYDENGNILSDEHVASFVGFLPADDPELIVLVVVDAADTSADTGAQIAAPIARVIMEQSYNYLRSQAASATSETYVEVPNIVGLTPEQAEEKLAQAGLALVLEGDKEYISAQVPAQGASVAPGSSVTGYAQDAVSYAAFVVMPDLSGMTREEAESALAQKGLVGNYTGSGKVCEQSVTAGEQIQSGSTVDVGLK